MSKVGKEKMSVEKVFTNRSGLPIQEFVFFLIACLFYSNYFVQSTYSYPMIVAFTGYVVYCIAKVKEYRKHIIWFMVMLLLFSILYLLLTDTSSISIYASNRTVKRFVSKYSQYLLVFFPVLMFYRTVTSATRRQVYLLIVLIIVNLLFLVQTSLKVVAVNPDILHRMNTDAVEESGLTIAAYYFVYAFTFLVLIGVVCFRHAQSPIVRWVALIMSFFFLYFLFEAQFALSLVTCFISVLYLYYVTTRKKSSRLFVVVGLIMVIILLPLIIRAIVSVLPSNILSDRLWEVYGMITGESVTTDNDGQSRLDLYWMCIKAFFSSPIIGNRTLPDDGHATFLTVPADIGIYGLIFLYVTFKNANMIVKRELGNKQIYFKPLMFQIILMGLTNPIHSSPTNYIMLFFLCPLVIMLFVTDKNEKNNPVLRSL